MPFLEGVKNGGVQAKLKVGPANDKYEVEADQMADRVMRMPAPSETEVNKEKSESFDIQRKSSNNRASGGASGNGKQTAANIYSLRNRISHIQRVAKGNETPTDHISSEQDELKIQRYTHTDRGRGPPSGDFSSKLNQSKGAGQAMDSGTQSFMNSRFGADFSNVKIHKGSNASQMSDDINAKAFTHQNHVYFNKGQYQPNTSSGKRLLAHELTHTIQQGAVNDSVQRVLSHVSKSQVQTKLKIGPVNDQYEQEADAMANRVMRSPSSALNISSHSDGIQRAKKKKVELEKPQEIIDLKGGLTISDEMIAWLWAQKKRRGTIDVKYGTYAKGTLEVKANSKRSKLISTTGKYQGLELNIAYLNILKRFGITPAAGIRLRKNVLTGYISTMSSGVLNSGPEEIFNWIRENAPKIGLKGVDLMNGFSNDMIASSFDQNGFALSVQSIPVKVGGFIDGRLSMSMENSLFDFSIDADVTVPLLDPTSFHLERDRSGKLSGEITTGFTIAKLNGKVNVKYNEGKVDIKGDIHYKDEQFDGQITILLTDYESAMNLAFSQLEPQEIASMSKVITDSNKSGQRALVGFGTVNFTLNEHFKGRVKVIVDGEGHVTVIGKLAQESEIPLFDPIKPKKKFVKPLFDYKIRYGIPLLASIGVGINMSLFADWGVQPATLRNLFIEGVYSTNPKLNNNRYTIGGNLNVSAFATAGVDIRVYGFGELLGHEVKIGLSLSASAKVEGYLDAGVILGSRPTKENPEKNEYFINGTVAMAAQPSVGLSSKFFVELDSPWWSPVPDNEWSWPLSDHFFPVAEDLGLQMDIDHIIGSKSLPSVNFKPHSFDPAFFMDSITEDVNSLKGDNGDKKMNSEFKDKRKKDKGKKKKRGKKNRKEKTKDKPSKYELAAFEKAIKKADDLDTTFGSMSTEKALRQIEQLKKMSYVRNVKLFKQKGTKHFVYLETDKTNNRQMKRPVYWDVDKNNVFGSQDDLGKQDLVIRKKKVLELENVYLKANRDVAQGVLFEKQVEFIRGSYKSRFKSDGFVFKKKGNKWEYQFGRMDWHAAVRMETKFDREDSMKITGQAKQPKWKDFIANKGRVKKEFIDAGGNHHEVYFKMRGNRIDMQMASANPGDIEPKIKKELAGPSAGGAAEKASLKVALKQVNSIENKMVVLIKNPVPKDSQETQNLITLGQSGLSVAVNLMQSGKYGDKPKKAEEPKNEEQPKIPEEQPKKPETPKVDPPKPVTPSPKAPNKVKPENGKPNKSTDPKQKPDKVEPPKQPKKPEPVKVPEPVKPEEKPEEKEDPSLRGLHTGKSDDPIPILWYKPPHKYPSSVTLHNVDGKTVTLGQNSGKRLKLLDKRNDAVIDTIRIGFTGKNMVRVGDKIVKQGRSSRNPQLTDRYRRVMMQHGYDMSKEVRDEDADHVKDLGFGGNDSYHNIWPLDSTINRRGFHAFPHVRVEYKKGTGKNARREERKMMTLPNKNFRIIGFGTNRGVVGRSRVQPKLKGVIGGDKYEIQADQTADRIMRKPLSKAERVSKSDNLISTLQRKTWDKEEEYNPYATIQRSESHSAKTPTVSRSFERGLQQSNGKGRGLDRSTKRFMENRFGNDFGGVNIHTGKRAADLNDQIGAKAFTVGNNIYFNQGQYNPKSDQGKRLLAHELTHTVQQGAAGDKVQREPEDVLSSHTTIENFGIVFNENGSEVTLFNRPEYESSDENSQLPIGSKVIVFGSEGNFYSVALFNDSSVTGYIASEDLVQAVSDGEGDLTVENDVHVIDKDTFDTSYPGLAYDIGSLYWDYHDIGGFVESLRMPEGYDDPTNHWAITHGYWSSLSFEQGRRRVIEKRNDYSAKNILIWLDALDSVLRKMIPLLAIERNSGGTSADQADLYLGYIRDVMSPGLETMQKHSYLDAGQEYMDRRSIIRVIEELEYEQQSPAQKALPTILTFLREHRVIVETQSEYQAYGALLAQLLSSNHRIDSLDEYGFGLHADGIREVFGLLQNESPALAEQALYRGETIGWLVSWANMSGFADFRASGEGLLSGLKRGYHEEMNTTEPAPFEVWGVVDAATFYLWYSLGVPSGLALGAKDLVVGLYSLFTPSFWKEMYRIFTDEAHRYEMGVGLGAAMAKEIRTYQSGDPSTIGWKLGVLMGRIAFEIIFTLLTSGAFQVTKAGMAAKFPRLARVAETVASSRVGQIAASGASFIIGKLDDIARTIRGLMSRLPPLTATQRMNRKIIALERELDLLLEAAEGTKALAQADNLEQAASGITRLEEQATSLEGRLDDLVPMSRLDDGPPLRQIEASPTRQIEGPVNNTEVIPLEDGVDLLIHGDQGSPSGRSMFDHPEPGMSASSTGIDGFDVPGQSGVSRGQRGGYWENRDGLGQSQSYDVPSSLDELAETRVMDKPAVDPDLEELFNPPLEPKNEMILYDSSVSGAPTEVPINVETPVAAPSTHSSQVADSVADITPVRTEPKTGRQLAADLDYPELPSGDYTWVRGRNGQPYVRRNNSSVEKIYFDPTDSTFKTGSRSTRSTAHLTDVSNTNFEYLERTLPDGTHVKQVRGELGRPGSVQQHRSTSAQRTVSAGTGEDAGHLVGNRFGAAGDGRNLSLQNREANQFGSYKRLEDSWADSLHNGHDINVDVADITRPGESRPFMRRVSWTDQAPDGTVTRHQMDFANTTSPESRIRAGEVPVELEVPGEVVPITRHPRYRHR